MAEQYCTVTATAAKIAVNGTNVVATITQNALAGSGFTWDDFFEAVSDAGGLDIVPWDNTNTTQYNKVLTYFDAVNKKFTLKFLVPSWLAGVAFPFKLHVGGSAVANNTTTFSTAGILGHWNFSQEPNGAGAGSVIDFTSNSNNLTPNGFDASGSSLVDAQINKGTDFNGSDEYESGLVSPLALSTRGFVETWQKIVSDRNGWERTIQLVPTVGSSSYMVHQSNTANIYSLGDSAHFFWVGIDGAVQWFAQGPANSCVVGSWQHVVWEHDGTTPYLFVNGVAKTLSWISQTNKTKWFKAVCTDATTKTTSMHVGGAPTFSQYGVVQMGGLTIGNTSSTLGANHWLTQYNMGSQSTFWTMTDLVPLSIRKNLVPGFMFSSNGAF